MPSQINVAPWCCKWTGWDWVKDHCMALPRLVDPSLWPLFAGQRLPEKNENLANLPFSFGVATFPLHRAA